MSTGSGKSMFGLSPAECRVAEMMKLGMDVAEISEAIKIKADTVRYYQKCVYRKTARARPGAVDPAADQTAFQHSLMKVTPVWEVFSSPNWPYIYCKSHAVCLRGEESQASRVLMTLK